MTDFYSRELILNLKNFSLNKRSIASLCVNEKACDFLKENLNKISRHIDWCSICSNPFMIPLIEENFDKLSFLDFSVLFLENENMNDLSPTFFCNILDKVLSTFTDVDEDYDEITDDDYIDTILDEICKKCNKLNILNKYIPKFIELKIFYGNCLNSIVQNPYAFPIIFEYFNIINKVDLYLNPNLPIKYVEIESLDYSHLFSLTFNKKMLPIINLNKNSLTLSSWHNLCAIEDNNVLNFIDDNIDELEYSCWSYICKNKLAINLIKKYFNKIMEINNIQKNEFNNLWDDISQNENKEILTILEENIENINWRYFSANKNVILFLRKHPQYLQKINWEVGAKNPVLMNVLINNKNILKNKIVYYEFLKNPALFQIKYDYEKIRNNFFFSPLGQGLIPIISHPQNYYTWQDSVFSPDEMDEVNSSNYSFNLDLSKNIILQILQNEKIREKFQNIFSGKFIRLFSNYFRNKKRKRELKNE